MNTVRFSQKKLAEYDQEEILGNTNDFILLHLLLTSSIWHLTTQYKFKHTITITYKLIFSHDHIFSVKQCYLFLITCSYHFFPSFLHKIPTIKKVRLERVGCQVLLWELSGAFLNRPPQPRRNQITETTSLQVYKKQSRALFLLVKFVVPSFSIIVGPNQLKEYGPCFRWPNTWLHPSIVHVGKEFIQQINLKFCGFFL